MIYHIKEIREKKRMTQNELCEKAGLTRQYLSQLENGTKKEIRVGLLKRIAEALKVSPASLFE